jgi:hypothetical protein
LAKVPDLSTGVGGLHKPYTRPYCPGHNSSSYQQDRAKQGGEKETERGEGWEGGRERERERGERERENRERKEKERERNTDPSKKTLGLQLASELPLSISAVECSVTAGRMLPTAGEPMKFLKPSLPSCLLLVFPLHPPS